MASEAIGGVWSNTRTGYGAVSRLVHWTTAILIGVNVAIGLYSMTLPRDIAWRDTILLYHKSFGLLVILLTVFRLVWIRLSPSRLDDSRLQRWEVVAAKAGHGLLYLLLLLVPLSGVMMSMGAGRDVIFFGLFKLPQMLPLDPSLGPRQQHYYLVGKFLHQSVFNWALYVAFALHMAGVIKHQFIDGDRGFLRRMWGAPQR